MQSIPTCKFGIFNFLFASNKKFTKSSLILQRKNLYNTIGALTNKSFSFELRGWEIEKFEAIDPTESFASNIKLLINNGAQSIIKPSNTIPIKQENQKIELKRF